MCCAYCVREASHIDFVHEKRHMDVLLETPSPPQKRHSLIIHKQNTKRNHDPYRFYIFDRRAKFLV